MLKREMVFNCNVPIRALVVSHHLEKNVPPSYVYNTFIYEKRRISTQVIQ